MVFDKLEHWRQYFGAPIWQQAFEFLEQLEPDAPEGEIALDGERLFARVMSYPTRTQEEAIIESHRRYIDIQMALINAEGIAWYPADSLEVSTPYDIAMERQLYRRPATAPARVDVHPGAFAVLFPNDAHMPQLIVGGAPATVKKVVVKVDYAETLMPC